MNSCSHPRHYPSVRFSKVQPGAPVLLLLLVSLLLSVPAASQDHVWRERLDADFADAVGINPLNPNTVYADGGGGPLLVSYNKGVTWGSLGSSPGISQIRQILVNPSDTLVILCVAFFGGLHRTSDYGQTWTNVLPNLGIDGESIALEPTHPDIVFFGNYSDGAVYRSTDRGMTWEFRSFAGGNLCALVSRPDSVEILYAGTGNGTMSKSTDSGLSWRVVLAAGSAEIPKICIDPQNPLVAYATAFEGSESSKGVWKTTDGGEQWVKIGLAGISVWAMDIDRNDPRIVYAGLFGYLGSAVYRTTDAGVTWDTIATGLPQYADAWNLKVHPLDPDMLWLAAGDIYRWTPSVATIQGSLLDAATADPVTNGFIEITSTGDRFELDSLSGEFSLHSYEGDPTLSPTAHIEAFPFYLKDEQLEFIIDSVIARDIELTRLYGTAIIGSVVDSNTQAPLSAEVMVSATTSLGDMSYVTSTDPNGAFQIDGLYVTYPPIVSYETIAVNPDFPYAQLTVTPVVLDSTLYVLNASLDTADVLITSSQGSGEFTGFYAGTLDSLGLRSHFWNPLTKGLAPLSRGAEVRKGMAIYYTGNDSAPLTDDELDSLSTALQLGVHMFISGQNFIESNDSSALLSQLLGVSHAGNTTKFGCQGVEGDLFSGLVVITAGGTGANNQTSRDIVQVEDPLAIPVLSYGFFGTDGVAAVRRDNTGSGARVVLFGFGFEAINSRTTREAVLRAIVGYLDGSIVLNVGDHTTGDLPLSYRLEQNYPNPFNPVTNFQFTIPNSQFVVLRVYDLLGREVATLVNEKKAPGTHRVTWDASGQSSGMYFYRLRAGDFVQTKKLVVLR